MCDLRGRDSSVSGRETDRSRSTLRSRPRRLLSEFVRQVLLHPAPAIAGIAAVTVALCVFVARVASRSWVPPTVVGLGLLTEAFATLFATRVFVAGFRENAPSVGEAGLKQVAATVLDSRVPRIVGAISLLALAAIGLASTRTARTSSEAAGETSRGTRLPLRAALTL